MLDKIKELIAGIPAPENYHEDDDFNPMDSSGGNFDDAYYMGKEEGRSQLAQQIREILELC